MDFPLLIDKIPCNNSAFHICRSTVYYSRRLWFIAHCLAGVCVIIVRWKAKSVAVWLLIRRKLPGEELALRRRSKKKPTPRYDRNGSHVDFTPAHYWFPRDLCNLRWTAVQLQTGSREFLMSLRVVIVKVSRATTRGVNGEVLLTCGFFCIFEQATAR